MKLTYKDAGVDKEAGYKEVKLIKEMVKSTFNDQVVSDIGGFSGLFRPDLSAFEKPILVSGTDGVGTKLDLAFKSGVHTTVGIDCVAMCVNDILCQGARPLFFLDYIATGKLLPEKMAQVVEGIADGCKQAGAALIGGETAEMPGIYRKDHYDLAGFAVGIVDEDKIISGKKVRLSDRLIGLRSSGIHSNGFSLVRKIVFDKMNFEIDQYIEELDKKLYEELLTPTRIYADVILPLVEKFDIHAISHITGGGIYENLPRVLKEGQRAEINLEGYEIPEIFKLLSKWGNVDMKEMFSTFNMGIGMVLVVGDSDYPAIKEYLESLGEDYIELGQIVEGEKGVDLCKLRE